MTTTAPNPPKELKQSWLARRQALLNEQQALEQRQEKIDQELEKLFFDLKIPPALTQLGFRMNELWAGWSESLLDAALDAIIAGEDLSLKTCKYVAWVITDPQSGLLAKVALDEQDAEFQEAITLSFSTIAKLFDLGMVATDEMTQAAATLGEVRSRISPLLGKLLICGPADRYRKLLIAQEIADQVYWAARDAENDFRSLNSAHIPARLTFMAAKPALPSAAYAEKVLEFLRQ